MTFQLHCLSHSRFGRNLSQMRHSNHEGPPSAKQSVQGSGWEFSSHAPPTYPRVSLSGAQLAKWKARNDNSMKKLGMQTKDVEAVKAGIWSLISLKATYVSNATQPHRQ